ncbi:arginine--tRNA ligase [Candidatus Riflebacteria bacterium]
MLPEPEFVKPRIISAVKKKFPDLFLNEPGRLEDFVDISVPRDSSHGHFACSVAMKLARVLKQNPREIASKIADSIGELEYFQKVEVAGPGFINLTFTDAVLLDAVSKLLEMKEKFGESKSSEAKAINIEFVSTNPTGPVNVVSGRAAVIGDALAAIFKKTGNRVQKEFYVNNVGTQVEKLTLSFIARIKEIIGIKFTIPEDGYSGEYLIPIAKAYLEKFEVDVIDDEVKEKDGNPSFKDFVLENIVSEQKEVLHKFKVDFDHWYFESWLHEKQKPQELLKIASEKNLSYKKDGAEFLKTEEYGDEKDRVLVKSDGNLTYFTNDIAYHLDKLDRGFQRLIDIWGPDHHGHVKRMKCALNAFCGEDTNLEVLIAQQVSLLDKGEIVKMGKRLGKTVDLADFMQQVPVDAIRYFFLDRNISSHLDFDIKLAVSQDKNNPVYYVQYAHARICQLFLRAIDKRRISSAEELLHWKSSNWSISTLERKIIWHLLQYPAAIINAADSREPSKLVQYLYETASLLQYFYQNKKNPNILDREMEECKLLLKISLAFKLVLANGLGLLNIEAREKM